MGNEILTVDVLGTRYEIIKQELPEVDEVLLDKWGYTDWTEHKIVVDVRVDGVELRGKETMIKKVMRHEIVHAFFLESGLRECSGSSDCWGEDETIVDWIAIQGPKIYAAWQSVGAV